MNHMRSILIGASLAALVLVGHTSAAEPTKAASAAPTATASHSASYVTITVPDADVQAYAAALQELPMKVAAPVYERLVQAYQKALDPAPVAKKP